MSDPRIKLLGRRYEADPRNELFPIRAMLRRANYLAPRSWYWQTLKILDQMNEGSCVGHGFAHEMLTDPYPRTDIDSKDAFDIYRLAQRLDDWPGEAYEGTSVLAGVKALKEMYRGIESYRWALDLKDTVITLGYFGPVVIGVNWHEGMFDTDDKGYIHVKGNVEGGHCVLLSGVSVEENYFTVVNSWGISWGVNGTAKLSFDDFDRLLRQQGEACVIVHKEWWKEEEVFNDGLQA